MDQTLRIVTRGNQRGGRALSVVDMIEAETLSREQVCWLLARIVEGSSWLVGAVPGGAGKTTVMSALLAMLPECGKVFLTNRGTGWEQCPKGGCVVSYEISPGSYDGYVWGASVRRLCELGASGRRIVSNLHADTLEQARNQVAGECGAGHGGLGAFELFLPVNISRRTFSFGRRVESIHWFADGAWHEIPRTGLSLAPEESVYGDFVDSCLERELRTCEDVRQEWLSWIAAQPAAPAP